MAGTVLTAENVSSLPTSHLRGGGGGRRGGSVGQKGPDYHSGTPRCIPLAVGAYPPPCPGGFGDGAAQRGSQGSGRHPDPAPVRSSPPPQSVPLRLPRAIPRPIFFLAEGEGEGEGH